MNYAWIVDVDHSPDPDEPPGTNSNAPNGRGPRNAPACLLARLTKGEGRAWKMHDDDGEIYYSGRIVFADPEDEKGDGLSLPEEAFGPLSDFGTPNAGATEIRYFIGGKWTQL